jgi:predicted Zn-dependent protease
MIDCLLNAFINAVCITAVGGLVSCLQRGAVFAEAGPGEGRSEFEDDRPPPSSGAPAAGPGLADRYIELARDYRRAGVYDKADSAWRLAHEMLVGRCAAAPGDAACRRRRFDCANDLAWFLLSRPDPAPNDRAEAVSLARQATEADPGNPVYWNTLAAALCRVGHDQAAIGAAERGLALESAVPSGFDFAVLALAHARMGRTGEAARRLAEAQEWRVRGRVERGLLNELIDEAQAALHS